ncbi:MAG TPA: hypothetical protein VGO96_15270, partial [Pyrinomonadaceae bacterium]|nr:hypothetical protein [Pyrinomonadaceae bacterium]
MRRDEDCVAQNELISRGERRWKTFFVGAYFAATFLIHVLSHDSTAGASLEVVRQTRWDDSLTWTRAKISSRHQAHARAASPAGAAI